MRPKPRAAAPEPVRESHAPSPRDGRHCATEAPGAQSGEARSWCGEFPYETRGPLGSLSRHWRASEVDGINDAGQIVGTGYRTDFSHPPLHAFIMTPPPNPPGSGRLQLDPTSAGTCAAAPHPSYSTFKTILWSHRCRLSVRRSQRQNPRHRHRPNATATHGVACTLSTPAPPEGRPRVSRRPVGSSFRRPLAGEAREDQAVFLHTHKKRGAQSGPVGRERYVCRARWPLTVFASSLTSSANK
jgi:hypothetical protein